MAAIRERFSNIDVAKHQLEVQRAGKKKLLTLTNEVKIITFPDSTWKLWEEVITCAGQGDLVNVDSKNCVKFKEEKGFNPDKDLVLSREFFKFLGNLSEEDHAKLCRHILNRPGPSRAYNYPKVVIKQPTSLLENCYSVKDWIERRKRKATAQLQLHKIRPELGLFKDDEFDPAAWKKFKKDYHVSKASMRALLEWGIPEHYWSNQRQTMHRNTPCEDLSPYAKQFFSNFLDVRSRFSPPQAAVHFRRFQPMPPISFGTWPNNSWSEHGMNAKLGIVDFRFIPGIAGKSSSSIEKPYFQEFMNLFMKQDKPAFTDLPCWMFICGDDASFKQVEAFAKKAPFAGVFELVPSKYIPAQNERLGGHAAKTKLAMESIRLLFLLNAELSLVRRPKKSYIAPVHVLYEKPRKYNELDYAVYPAELRMEFFLDVFGHYCKKGDSTFLLFVGKKAIAASVVRLIIV